MSRFSNRESNIPRNGSKSEKSKAHALIWLVSMYTLLISFQTFDLGAFSERTIENFNTDCSRSRQSHSMTMMMSRAIVRDSRCNGCCGDRVTRSSGFSWRRRCKTFDARYCAKFSSSPLWVISFRARKQKAGNARNGRVSTATASTRDHIYSRNWDGEICKISSEGVLSDSADAEISRARSRFRPMEIYISMPCADRDRDRDREEEGRRETLEHRKRNRSDMQGGLESVGATSKQ